MLYIRDLYIYPLKSGAGHRVPSLTLDPLGAVGDRRWMVVDRDHRFLTQRELSQMALIHAERTDEGLALTAPDMPRLSVTTPDAETPRVMATLWDDVFAATPAGGDVATTWLTQLLGVDARLMYCPPDVQRPVDPTYAFAQERVSFADGFPLLVIGQGSLDDLNTRLEAADRPAVPMNRFRPNLVIGGSAPFAEDNWQRLRIGTGDTAIDIDIVKPCARCSIIPVDQATGIRGKEPLALLSTYRRRDKKVYFGQNALHRSLGTIHEGAAVALVER